MQTFTYFRPTDLSELFDLMQHYPAACKLLAGGTDLLVRLKSGKIAPDAIIDIKAIPEIQGAIKQLGGSYVIGALTLMADLEYDPIIQTIFPALAEAVHNIGSVQVRNRATIAGNLCNASPAADSAPALLIYNAVVVCLSPRGERKLALQKFLTGPGTTALTADEIVKQIILPTPPANQAAAFARLTRRKGVDLATINLCCQVNSNGLTRFVLGAVGPVPVVVEEKDGLLTSPAQSDAAKKACIADLMRKATPITDVRASKEYRQAMLEVLGFRVLMAALKRLGSGA
jgi:carbon-monoxide dehydrogenase medium subunit